MLRLLIIVGVGLIFGLVIGRWWALFAAPVVSLILFEPGPAGDDISGLVFVAAALVEIGVLIGLLVRKIASVDDDSIRPPPGRVE